MRSTLEAAWRWPWVGWLRPGPRGARPGKRQQPRPWWQGTPADAMEFAWGQHRRWSDASSSKRKLTL